MLEIELYMMHVGFVVQEYYIHLAILHVMATCVGVCEVVSFILSFVESSIGPLRSVQGSGFWSTSGPALCTKTALSLIYYKPSLSHTHTHIHTRALHAFTHPHFIPLYGQWWR